MKYTAPVYRQPRKTKRTVIAGIVVALALTGTAGAFWATSSNEGVVVEATPRPVKKPVENQLFNGKYFQFSYRGIYHLSYKPAVGSDLEVANLNADTNYEKHVAVVISQLPQSKLENNPNYNMRKNSPQAYSSRTVVVDGGQAVVYTKADSEQTAFMQRGDKVAILSFTTTTDNLDNLEPEIDAALKTFRWKG